MVSGASHLVETTDTIQLKNLTSEIVRIQNDRIQREVQLNDRHEENQVTTILYTQVYCTDFFIIYNTRKMKKITRENWK